MSEGLFSHVQTQINHILLEDIKKKSEVATDRFSFIMNIPLLTVTTLWEHSADDKLIFPQRIGFDISCKMQFA